MLSHCSFLGTALYGYVALALRAKQWEDGSIMPVTVRGARGGMTRALWLRMYAAACPGHACTATEHGRWHWEGWIHPPNAEGMCVCVGCRSERGAAGVCCRRIGQSAPSIKNKKNSLACVCACALCLVGFLPTPPPELEFSYLPGCVDQAFLDAPKANKMRAGYLFGSRGVYFFLKKDHDQLRPAGACCAAAGNALAKRQSKAVEGGPKGR